MSWNLICLTKTEIAGRFKTALYAQGTMRNKLLAVENDLEKIFDFHDNFHFFWKFQVLYKKEPITSKRF